MKSLASLSLAALSFSAQAGVLYDNGTPLNAPGWSFLSSPYSRLAIEALPTNPVADNFTVSGAAWTVTDFDIFAVQFDPAQQAQFSFSSVTWSIRTGQFISASTELASGVATASNAGFVGYRTTQGSTSMTRAIFDVKVDIPDTVLPEGRYWLTFGLTGSSALGTPSVVPTGDGRIPGSAYMFRDGAWIDLSDPNIGAPPDLSFVVNGSLAPVPEPATAATLLAGAVLLAGQGYRRRLRTAEA